MEPETKPTEGPQGKGALFAFLIFMLAAFVVGCALLFGSGGGGGSDAVAPGTGPYAKKQARIKTRHGDMVARFFPDVAPKTVENFCTLAQKGFYDGLIFHRVIRDFMIQGGDPDGTGMGGPGYTIKAEFSKRPHKRGTLSMARSADPDSAGSQFFIVHGAHVAHLDGSYTVFGELVSGLEVLDRIATAPTGPNDKPVEPVKMDKVIIEDGP